MIEITRITQIGNKKHIALWDTSSISFMQGLQVKGLQPDIVLEDYDLILIPEWVLVEINDAEGRGEYVEGLIRQGYPIFSIAEENYSELANGEEGNLYQIVLASTYQIGRIKSYLRRYVEKKDLLDMEAYKEWINKLYDEWPISDQMLSSGRIKKKNAGEVSITILAEVVSWYYPETEIFSSITPVPVSYKSNDAIICQLVRDGKIDIDRLSDYRKDIRKITYSKEQDDYSVILVTELVDNELFVQLVKDKTVHIIF